MISCMVNDTCISFFASSYAKSLVVGHNRKVRGTQVKCPCKSANFAHLSDITIQGEECTHQHNVWSCDAARPRSTYLRQEVRAATSIAGSFEVQDDQLRESLQRLPRVFPLWIFCGA